MLLKIGHTPLPYCLHSVDLSILMACLSKRSPLISINLETICNFFLIFGLFQLSYYIERELVLSLLLLLLLLLFALCLDP